MNGRLVTLLGVVAIGGVSLWSQGQGHVVRRGQGEQVFDGSAIIKVSPRTGSQGAEMIWQSLADGAATGIHTHDVADEFFYVIRGSGFALVGGQETAVEAGDVIFVPKGSEHRLRGPGAGTAVPLEVVFLVDRPWLSSEFREGQAEYERLQRDLTLEEVNRISQKYGTTHRTLQ